MKRSAPRPQRGARRRPAPTAAKSATVVVLLNKPYGVLCQFSDRSGRRTLADFVSHPEVYPAGRLDFDSEGLVLLTNDGSLAQRVSDPRYKLAKTYLTEVEGLVSADALTSLRGGVLLSDGPTLPAEVEALSAAPDWLWPRDPPIRIRKSIPTAWLRISLREGRNRQVRRMTAAVGLPTLRLIRVAIGPHQLNGLQPGEHRLA